MKSFILTIIAMIVGFSAVTAHAEFQKNRYCIRFNATYDDNGKGEDYLKTDGLVGVAHVPYTITRSFGTVASGELDADGCTAPVKLTIGNTYKINITYKVNGPDGRSVKFLSTYADSWDNGKIVSYYTTTKVVKIVTSDGGPATITRIMPNTVHGRLMPIARLMMQRAVLLDWRSNVEMAYAINNPSLCHPLYGHYIHTGSQNSLKKICYSIDHQKTASVHEAGHAIAHMNNGPSRGDYRGDSFSGARWRANGLCRQGADAAADTHIFHSREWVGAAAREGFSHFIAAATYNIRSANNGTFTYYKNNIWVPSGTNPTDPATQEGRFYPMPLNGVGATGTLSTFTDRYCRPPTQYEHLGSEQDWLYFFWALWTGAENVRYEVDEINKVWDAVSGKETKIDVHCFPLKIFPDGEQGWTCLDYPWKLITNALSPTYTFFGIEYRPVKSFHSIPSQRGKAYVDVADATRTLHGTIKADFFEAAASRSKVLY